LKIDQNIAARVASARHISSCERGGGQVIPYLGHMSQAMQYGRTDNAEIPEINDL
jgi:hypothetical protein